MNPPPTASDAVPFRDAFWFWVRLGFINFGGPTGQIAIMHQELVERRRWISNNRFLHALSYCMVLPGPEAQQLATYVGWLLHRTLGGLVAGIFFILPGFFVILGLSWVYAAHGNVSWVAAIFYGLRAAVIAIVAAAVIRIGARALKNPVMITVALVAFGAIFFLGVPFPAIVFGAGLIGLAGGGWQPEVFNIAQLPVPDDRDPAGDASQVVSDMTPAPPHARPTLARAGGVLFTGLLVWWGPLFAVALWRGWQDVLAQQAFFFSKMAVVTFGGAYAVLAYMAQAAVEHYQWLTPGEMLDGLGLAESTPGPLIMVTQFVGFLGAFRHPSGLDPVAAGTLGALVTVWATFAPCFLWIFLGAPLIEHFRGHRLVGSAFSTITAAVVGVMVNLAAWFGLHTLFGTVAAVQVAWARVPVPHVPSLDPFALMLSAAAFVAVYWGRLGIFPVVAASAAVGLLRQSVI